MTERIGGHGPDFVCIGAQKAGTTWLYENLAVQPGIWLPPIKEIHFFDRVCANEQLLGVEEQNWVGVRERWGPLLERPSLQTLRWLRRFHRESCTTAWYRSLFPPRLVHGRITGDITPAYSTLDERGVEFARRVLRPGTRVLLLIRHPVDRVWSALKMMYRWKGDGIEAAELEAILAEMDQPGHRLRTDYPRMIRLWRETFEDDFRVFEYDQLRAEPDRLLTSILGFIGAEGKLVTSRLRHRPNRDPARRPIPPEIQERLAHRFRPQIEELAELLPGLGDAWLDPGASSSSYRPS